MRNVTLRPWALLILLLLAGPAWAQPTWQWAAGAVALNNGASEVAAVAVDGSGNTVVAGYFSGMVRFGTTVLTTTGGADIFVARLNAVGVWTQVVQAGGSGDDTATALAVDAAGNATVAGIFSTSASFGATTLSGTGNSLVFVARLNAAGSWNQAVQGGPLDSAYPNALAVDGAGTVTIAGSFNGAAAHFGAFTLANVAPAGAATTDIFVARLSAAGIWTQAVRAGGMGSDGPTTLAADVAGNCMVGGYFQQGAAFGSFALLSTGTGISGTNGFVARLSAAGTWTQAVAASGPDVRVLALRLDSTGGTVAAGYFTGTTNFGTTALTTTGYSAPFVARLNAAGTWTQARHAIGTGSGTATNRPGIGCGGQCHRERATRRPA